MASVLTECAEGKDAAAAGAVYGELTQKYHLSPLSSGGITFGRWAVLYTSRTPSTE